MELKISVKDINEIILLTGKILVGKLFKRTELFFDNKEIFKKAAKEILYEEMRSLRNLLIARGTDKEIVIFESKEKPESKKEWKKL